MVINLKYTQNVKSKVSPWCFSLYCWDKRDYKHEWYLKSIKCNTQVFTSFNPFKLKPTASDRREPSFEGPVYFIALLTHFRHLRHHSYKGPIWKFGCIVIDVLYFDDEFRLWFQGLLCMAVQGLRMQDIMCFLFPIQTLSGMNISCHFIDDKYSPSSFPVQNVSDGSIAFIWVRVKLQGEPDRRSVKTQNRTLPKLLDFDSRFQNMIHGCKIYNGHSAVLQNSCRRNAWRGTSATMIISAETI